MRKIFAKRQIFPMMQIVQTMQIFQMKQIFPMVQIFVEAQIFWRSLECGVSVLARARPAPARAESAGARRA
jgi:hypothetical protein